MLWLQPVWRCCCLPCWNGQTLASVVQAVQPFEACWQCWFQLAKKFWNLEAFSWLGTGYHVPAAEYASVSSHPQPLDEPSMDELLHCSATARRSMCHCYRAACSTWVLSLLVLLWPSCVTQVAMGYKFYFLTPVQQQLQAVSG